MILNQVFLQLHSLLTATVAVGTETKWIIGQDKPVICHINLYLSQVTHTYTHSLPLTHTNTHTKWTQVVNLGSFSRGESQTGLNDQPGNNTNEP